MTACKHCDLALSPGIMFCPRCGTYTHDDQLPTIQANTSYGHTVSDETSYPVPPPPPPLRDVFFVHPPYRGGPPQKPKKRSMWLYPILGVLCLLIIGGSFGAFFYTQRIQDDQRLAQATATAQTQANVGATTQAQQATKQSVADTQATSQATTTVALDPYTKQKTLSISDPLTQPLYWDKLDGTGGNCAFTQSAYHIKMQTANTLFLCYGKQTYLSDYVFEVKMTIVSGDCGGFVLNNEGGTTGNMYYAVFCNDGEYTLYLVKNSVITTTLGSGITTALTGTNTIAVAYSQGAFTLYLNHQVLKTIKDTIYQRGYLGLLAYNVTHATEVSFSDVKIWT